MSEKRNITGSNPPLGEKRGIYLYLEIEVITKAKQKGLNLSQIANTAIREAVLIPKTYLKNPNPEKPMEKNWNQVPKKYRVQAEHIFSKQRNGLVPNLSKPSHAKALIAIYHKLVAQTTLKQHSGGT